MPENIDQTTQPILNPTENYPIQAQIPKPEQSSRLLALLTLLFFAKAILLVPHLIITYFLSLFAFIAFIAGQVMVLFTGAYPPSLFALIKGFSVWQFRLNAYMFGLTDAYPPFAFDVEDRSLAMTAIKRILIVVLIIFALIVLLAIFSN